MIPFNWKQLYLKRNATQSKGFLWFLSMQAVHHNNRSQIDTYIMHFNMNTNEMNTKQKIFSYHFHSGNHANGMRYTIDWLYELYNKEIFQIHLRVFLFSLIPLHAPSHCSLSCACHLIAAMKFQIRTNIAMQMHRNPITTIFAIVMSIAFIFVHSNTIPFGAIEFDFIAVLISKHFPLLPFVRLHFFVSSPFSTCRFWHKFFLLFSLHISCFARQ